MFSHRSLHVRRSTVTGFTLISFIFISWAYITRANDDEEQNPPCRLWLGPSYLTSDSNFKLGLYAGIDYKANDILPSYEVGFPLYDFLDNPARKISSKHRATIEYIESLLWTSDHAGTAKWEANSSLTVFIPGIGIVPNFHTGVYNADWDHSSVLLREPYIPSQQATAGRGAISPYYNFSIRATRSIPVGMEIFPMYEDVWYEHTQSNENDIYQETMKRPDYESADNLIDKILEFFDKFEGQMNAELKEDVFEFMMSKVLDGNAGKRARVYRSLVPDHLPKLKKVKEVGGTFHYRYQDMVRSPQWLQEHALCVDNLDVRLSTIPHAGRGAFARRTFKEGDIISPVPMVPIPTEEVLHLYDPIETTSRKKGNPEIDFDSKEPSGFQIMLNYLYGHPESTLHLLPTAPLVNFVNHGSNGSANAQMVWSDHEYVYNDHNLHDKLLNTWDINEVPSIVLNLVATRDIDVGEEVLINYGPEWESSWNEHFAAWQMKYNETGIPKKWPLKAQDTLALYEDKPYPVGVKEGMTPYPDGVVTGCYLFDGPAEVPDGEPRLNEHGQDIFKWQGGTKEDLRGHGLTICDVLERIPIYTEKDGEKIETYQYTVLTRFKEGKKSNLVQVEQVPHYAITLIDRPYTSDIHGPDAFRHWIGINDAIFPQAWRNLR